MNARPFGRMGTPVSEITYGAMTLEQGEVHNGVSTPLLHALDCDVTCIDTARAYGKSEEIIGRTLQEWKGKRPFLASKIAPLSSDGWRHFVELEKTFTPESMRKSVEESLRALQVDCIDFIELHQWYYLWTHRREWLETFHSLKAEGKIRGFGISAQDHEHDAVLQVVDAGLIDGLQVIFNAFESRPLTSLLPLAGQRNIAVIARGVLDHGGLSGQMTLEQMESHKHLKKGPPSKYAARIAGLQRIARDTGQSLLELAIRFALTPAPVTTLTMSLHTRSYIDEAVRAAELGPLDEETFQAIVRNNAWTKNFWEKDEVDYVSTVG
jgi:aryl-alcohol dehydrogenase-like predicted oxidoreductase